MRGWRRICGGGILAGILVGVLTLALAPPTLAGGWAVITLDALPTDARAGQALSLGFMVRQHGVTPIDRIFDGAILTPLLTARNTTTGATLRVEGRKEGPLGHFVVDVTFPDTGAWQWSIAPPPFAATDLGTLNVAPATAAVAQTEGFSARSFAPATAREGLRWLAGALVFAALGLWVWRQRVTLLRLRPHRAS